MDNNTGNILLATMCCLGFAGVVFLVGVVLAVVLWPKKKTVATPSQEPSTSQTSLSAEKASPLLPVAEKASPPPPPVEKASPPLPPTEKASPLPPPVEKASPPPTEKASPLPLLVEKASPPPPAPSPTIQSTEPSTEAIEHFNRAIDKWNNTEESKRDDNLRRDICAELALAIKKASAPLPRAHALLAMFLNDLGDDKNAAYHANIALQQNPDEFRAQLVRIDVALKGVKVTKVRGRDLIEFSGGFDNMYWGTVGRLFGAGISSLSSRSTQASFKNEVVRLAQIFKNVCKTNTDVDEYLMMAQALIALGDFIKDVPMPGGRPNLYLEVLSAPTEQLDKVGQEEKILEVRRMAEGRSLLFKS